MAGEAGDIGDGAGTDRHEQARLGIIGCQHARDGKIVRVQMFGIQYLAEDVPALFLQTFKNAFA